MYQFLLKSIVTNILLVVSQHPNEQAVQLQKGTYVNPHLAFSFF